MTFAQLLFWIVLVILFIFLLKVGLAILIIVLVIAAIVYIIRGLKNEITENSYEGYQGNIPYPIYQTSPFVNNGQFNQPQLPPQSYVGTDTGHSNYLYIPIQEYLDEQMNGTLVPQSCTLPGSISEYCVNKKLQETGNLAESIQHCRVPGKTGVYCSEQNFCQ